MALQWPPTGLFHSFLVSRLIFQQHLLAESSDGYRQAEAMSVLERVINKAKLANAPNVNTCVFKNALSCMKQGFLWDDIFYFTNCTAGREVDGLLGYEITFLSLSWLFVPICCTGGHLTLRGKKKLHTKMTLLKHWVFHLWRRQKFIRTSQHGSPMVLPPSWYAGGCLYPFSSRR